MKEEWKDIPGFYGSYQISNYGRVRIAEHTDSIGRIHHQKIKKPQMTIAGYYCVTLFDKITKKYKLKLIHRLVAEMFIPNPKGCPIVNHKDCNPTNNALENLEWCDYAYNNTYGQAISKRNATRLLHNPNGECWKKTAEKNKKPVIQYLKDGSFLRHYASTKDAVMENSSLGFKRENISQALRGVGKTAYGYCWAFA